MIASQRTVHTT